MEAVDLGLDEGSEVRVQEHPYLVEKQKTLFQFLSPSPIVPYEPRLSKAKASAQRLPVPIA
jgi:hypothetical protein